MTATVESVKELILPNTSAVAPDELEYVAFSGRHEIAHGMFRALARGEWPSYASKYTLSEVIIGGIHKLRRFLSVSAEDAATEEKEFLDDVMEFFLKTSRERRVYPRELFTTLLLWSEELTRLSLLRESLRNYDQAIELGVNRYPDLYVRTLLTKAGVLNMVGKFQAAQALLASLAERPYIITDRKVVPELVFNLGRESLLKGDVEYYKSLLFRGLRHFYTNIDNRRLFVDQIRKTYRRSYRVLFDREVCLPDKVLFVFHLVYFKSRDHRLSRLIPAHYLLRFFLLGYLYWLNYFRLPANQDEHPANLQTLLLRSRNGNGRAQQTKKRKNILITRAMGGIGDLLMMTPAFHGLKQKYPDEEIHLAIPRRYFPVFQGNDDVKVIDIENDSFSHRSYRRWYNFTDCPAARVESRTAPKVRKTRIDIFAGALGLNFVRRSKMDRRPRYFVSEDEREFQQMFWNDHRLHGKTVIGIQLRSDEVYRDYPYMRQIVTAVAERANVLVFDGEQIDGFAGNNIVKVGGLPMRQAFALASACDVIIAPDSAFVHLAAALDIPTVALYGPIDATVRTRHYPKCIYLDARQKLGCLPCWRNESIPCKLTNMRMSVCMGDIMIADIQRAVTQALTGRTAA